MDELEPNWMQDIGLLASSPVRASEKTHEYIQNMFPRFMNVADKVSRAQESIQNVPGSDLVMMPMMSGLVKYLKVKAKDYATGKTINVYLKDPVDKGKFLSGVEVNKFGDDIIPRGATERLHIIDKDSIVSQMEHEMNLKYGELEPIKKKR